MLTLTRRPHEEIVVIDTQTGERIIVAAIGCRGNEMKIGIEATERFRILRRELVEGAPSHSD